MWEVKVQPSESGKYDPVEDKVTDLVDHEDWKNLYGTGPFIPIDYVSGSSVTMAKNPNYWRPDPTAVFKT